jgi:hypothetical protein
MDYQGKFIFEMFHFMNWTMYLFEEDSGRCFGVLKRRFPILAYGCRLKLDRILSLIIRAMVLHNICIEEGDLDAPPLPEELNLHVLNNLIENGDIPELNEHGNNNGQQIRHYVHK